MMNASPAHDREPVDTQTWVRAAGEGDAERVKSLLAAGADINAATENGETALIRATSKGHLHIVRLLLDEGADLNAEREDGFTALGLAVFLGNADIVRALLASGADPSAKGRLGATAEKWALFSGFNEIVEMLRIPRASGEQRSGAGAPAANAGRTADAPMFFPAEGTFKSVVPLSDISEANAPESYPTPREQAEPERLELVRDTRRRHEPEEHELETLIRPRRASDSISPRPTPAVRLKGARQSWRVTAVTLSLSLIAGLLVGTYLMGLSRPVETAQPAPLAGDAAPAPEAATESVESQTATTAPAPQGSQTETPLAAPRLSSDDAAASALPLAGAAGTDSTSENAKGNKSASPSAPATARAEDERARRAASSSRRETPATDASAVRTSRPAVTEKTGEARRAEIPRRARSTGGGVLTSSSRENSLPVFSPTPASNPETKKVIPWP